MEVECINNGYELVGESSLSCEVCEENYKADTVMCLSPTLGERTLPECRLKPGWSTQLFVEISKSKEPDLKLYAT